MPKEFSRSERLGGQMLRVLNDLLRQESKDPRVIGVSISAVELSRDLSVADVFFSLLDPNSDPEPATAGLASATGFLRSRVAKALKIRHAPELRFRHDDSAARAADLSELIAAAQRGDAE